MTKTTIVNGNVTRLNLKTLFDGQTYNNVTMDIVLQALGNGSSIISSALTTVQKTNQSIR